MGKNVAYAGNACAAEVTASSREGASARPSGKRAAPRRKPSQGKKNKELGRRGEEAAVYYLERRGYEILFRNWTCIAGEADIIATDGNYLVFVEVKTRSDADRGFPAESVNAKKRERYEKIAALFLQDHRLSDVCVRFDVVSIISYGSDRAFIRHHLAAFA